MEFVTAVRNAAQDDAQAKGADQEGTPFTIKETDAEGKVVHEQHCVAFRPGDGQIGMLLAMVERHHSIPTRVAGVINFFVNVLDEDSYEYVVSRLMEPDHKDPFGLEDVTAIAIGLVEEWTGRPTRQSSPSTGGRQNTGPTSTQPMPVST